MDANPDAPIAAWFRASRASQGMDDGSGGTKPWTVKHFLGLLEAEEGWAPAHSNYSNYELGKQTPTPATLKRFVDFWARRGIAAPDLTPPTPIPTEGESLIAALGAQTVALGAQTAAITELAAQLRALVQHQPTAAATAHLVSEAVVGALRVALPDVLRDARLPRK